MFFFGEYSAQHTTHHTKASPKDHKAEYQEAHSQQRPDHNKQYTAHSTQLAAHSPHHTAKHRTHREHGTTSGPQSHSTNGIDHTAHNT